MEPKVHYQV